MCEQQAQAAAPQEEQWQLLQQMVSRIMNVGPIPSCPYKLVLLEQEPTRHWLQDLHSQAEQHDWWWPGQPATAAPH